MEKIYRFIEAVDACAARLDELNSRYPQLATETSTQGVDHWRKRRLAVGDEHRAGNDQESGEAARRALVLGLLQNNGLEDVLDILLAEHQLEMTLPELIELVGREAYIAALRSEARQLTSNAISFEQIANLWNDLDRPPLGSTSWKGSGVSILVE